MGFAGDTKHSTIRGEIPISPIQSAEFPDWTRPEDWLVCEVCQEPIDPNGEMAILVFEEIEPPLRAVRLVHKGDCDPSAPQSGWTDISDLTNPELYMDFIKWLIYRLAEPGWKLRDARPLVNALLGMYRQVFRPSTSAEHLRFAQNRELHRMGLEQEPTSPIRKEATLAVASVEH